MEGDSRSKERSWRLLGKVAVIALLVITVAAAPRAASAAPRSTSEGVVVLAAPTDPLEYVPDAVLIKDGFTVYHPVGTIHYADGGYATVFDTKGGKVTMPVPPNGFEPRTASNAELVRYGFPTRPSTTDLGPWDATVASMRITAPTLKLIELPQHATTYQLDNWAGYAENGPSSHYYRQVTGTWQEPSITGSCGAVSSVAIWVGLAGGGTFPVHQTDIEQTGTYSYDDPVSGLSFSHEMWWEDYPTQNILLSGGFARAGDTVFSSVTDLQYLGQKAFDWSVNDETTGTYKAGTQSLTSAYLTQQVEWVDERVTSGGGPTDLIPHTPVAWASTFESWGSGSGNAHTVAASAIQMWSTDFKRELEYESRGLTSGGAFTTSWDGSCS